MEFKVIREKNQEEFEKKVSEACQEGFDIVGTFLNFKPLEHVVYLLKYHNEELEDEIRRSLSLINEKDFTWVI